jgi:uracil-DNA glycosylase
LKELIEEIYSCRSSHNCLKEWVDCRVPEPFIGNLHSSFAIIGTNPGSYENQQKSFKDLTEYVNYYEKEFYKSASHWIKRYCEAYRMLVNPDADLTVFNENAIILNVVKCSTSIKWSKLPEEAREEARSNCNCINYLVRQLGKMQPSVILAHGKPACIAIMDMLKDDTKFRSVSTYSGKGINKLAKEIRLPNSMNGISEEIIQAKNENGRRIGFLFNKHLSIWGPARNSLEKNEGNKKTMIDDLLRQ